MAVVGVVVVASVVTTVMVLVTRVVSVTDKGEVVVVDVVVTSVDVLDEVETTVMVVDGAATVIVSGKYPRQLHAEEYFAKLVHGDAYAGKVEPTAVACLAASPFTSTVRVVVETSVCVEVCSMVAVSSNESVSVEATTVSTAVDTSTTVEDSTMSVWAVWVAVKVLGVVNVLARHDHHDTQINFCCKYLVAGVTVTLKYDAQSAAPFLVGNASPITAKHQQCKLGLNLSTSATRSPHTSKTVVVRAVSSGANRP